MGVHRLRPAIFSVLAIFVLIPVLPWLQIRSWAVVVEFYAALAAIVGVYIWMYRRGRTSNVINLTASFVMILAFTRVIGPWILTPIVLVGSAFPMSANTKLNARPVWLVVWLVACITAPLALEWTGVFAQSWRVSDLGVISTSSMFVGSGSVDAFALVFTNVVVLAAAVLFGLYANRRAIHATRRVMTQAWHLEQLLPAGRVSVR